MAPNDPREIKRGYFTGAYFLFVSTVLYVVGFTEPFWSPEKHEHAAPTWKRPWEFANLGLRCVAVVCLVAASFTVALSKCGRERLPCPRITMFLVFFGAISGITAEGLLLIFEYTATDGLNHILLISQCLCGFCSCVALVAAAILVSHLPAHYTLDNEAGDNTFPLLFSRDGWAYCRHPFNWVTYGEVGPSQDAERRRQAAEKKAGSKGEEEDERRRETEPLLPKLRESATRADAV